MIDVQSFDTLNEAASALNGQSKYFGGGTLLMRQVNYGDQSFNRLVYSKDPALKAIRLDGALVHIGAGCTMKGIIDHPDLGFLSKVARSVGGPAIRNMATLGGNLFAPRPYGDFTTALLALNASIRWSDGQEQTIDAFLQGSQIGQGVVATISVGIPAGDSFKYLKVSRVKPKGVSVMTLAAFLQQDIGRISGARLAFGGMGAVPMRATAAENALMGGSLDENAIKRACEVVNDDLKPEDDALASAWYRKQVAPIHLSRLLLQRGSY